MYAVRFSYLGDLVNPSSIVYFGVLIFAVLILLMFSDAVGRNDPELEFGPRITAGYVCIFASMLVPFAIDAPILEAILRGLLPIFAFLGIGLALVLSGYEELRRHERALEISNALK